MQSSGGGNTTKPPTTTTTTTTTTTILAASTSPAPPSTITSSAAAPQCPLCSRPNCCGARNHRANHIYLGCRQCGRELTDVRPLFADAARRSASTCELCGLRYRHGTYANLHFLSHFSELSSASGPLFCGQCGQEEVVDTTDDDAATTVMLAVQEDAAVGEEIDDDDYAIAMQEIETLDYECDLCDTDELYSTVEALSVHRRHAHGVVEEDASSERDTNTIEAGDQSKDHDDDDDVVATARFQCPQCSALFANRTQLLRHRSAEHPKRKRQQRQSQSANGEEDTTEENDSLLAISNNEFLCRLCDETTTTTTTPFASRASLRAHEDACHRDADTAQFPCTHCDRSYACASFLALHLLKHTKRKRFACPECGEHFGRLAHMQYHRSTHTDQKRFECERCDDDDTTTTKTAGQRKRFKTAESLRRHQVHMHPIGGATAAPRYPCELCDRVFKDSSDLRRHRWSHGGFEKRFGCSLCDKRFYEMRSLRAHQRTHERKKATGMAAPRGELRLARSSDDVLEQ